MQVSKKYILSNEQKEVMARFLEGEMTYMEAGNVFDVQPSYMSQIVTTIMRRLVMEGKVDIRSLLKQYK